MMLHLSSVSLQELTCLQINNFMTGGDGADTTFVHMGRQNQHEIKVLHSCLKFIHSFCLEFVDGVGGF